MEIKKANTNVWRAFSRTTPLIVKSVPGMCVVFSLSALLAAVSYGLAAPVAQRLFDALAALAEGGTFRAVYTGIVFVAGLALFQQITESVWNFMFSVFNTKADGKLSKYVHYKMARLPAAFFEDKERLDDLDKVNEGKYGAMFMLQGFLNILFFNAAYIAVMGIYLWSLRPLLLLALVMTFIPELLTQIIQAKIMAKLEDKQAPVRRQNEHYENCITGGDTLKETRLFGAYFFFKRLFMDSLKLLAQNEWNTKKKMEAINLGLNLVKAAGWIGVMLLLFSSLTGGYISVGAFAAVFTSIGLLFGMISFALNQIKQSITENVGKINNFLNILDYPTPQLTEREPDFNQGVVVTDISFSYPKADKPAVHGVTLTLYSGETLALVGENGSGKSTLVKLLCGLYKPSAGTVIVGGCDTATTEEESLFSKTSAVFQWTGEYAFDVAGNIAISDVTSEKDPGEVLHYAGIDLTDTATYPKGIETMLIREFDGVQLSGGQWQRIGTARGLYRRHEFILLDEPTSAIDPLEEAKMYKRFAELAKGKMAVLVTHRLGSVKIADKIIVMDEGTVIETGTHDSLLAAKGKYAAMWAAQAEGYA
jgi:ATP-binding cassette subfamily B protein